MYTSVVSHKRGIGNARVSVRKWKHPIKSESLESARQFRKKSEILCPPSSLGRQSFYAIPSQPFGRPKAGDVYASARRRKSTLGRNGGDKVSLACAHQPLLPFGLLPPPLWDTLPRLSLSLSLPRHFCRVIDVWIKGLSLSVKGRGDERELGVTPP